MSLRHFILRICLFCSVCCCPVISYCRCCRESTNCHSDQAVILACRILSNNNTLDDASFAAYDLYTHQEETAKKKFIKTAEWNENTSTQSTIHYTVLLKQSVYNVCENYYWESYWRCCLLLQLPLLFSAVRFSVFFGCGYTCYRYSSHSACARCDDKFGNCCYYLKRLRILLFSSISNNFVCLFHSRLFGITKYNFWK